MMSPSTCAPAGQVPFVFLLVFAVRNGQLKQSIRRETLPMGLDGWRHWLSRLRSNRVAWVFVTGYFLSWRRGSSQPVMELGRYRRGRLACAWRPPASYRHCCGRTCSPMTRKLILRSREGLR